MNGPAAARSDPPTRPFVLAAAVVGFAAAPALGAEPPKLPPTAKQLTGPQIVALYDGKTFTFTSYTFWGVVTGEASYDFKTKKNHGTYQLGSHHGTFDGTIRISGNQFCYKAGFSQEHCNSVYVDGDEVYEVRPSGKIESVDEAKKAIPPA
jgi:hypothetical protein